MNENHANIGRDRTGGRRGNATVKPPVVLFSTDFTLPENSPRPYKTEELGEKAAQRGFLDAKTPQAQHILETIGFQHACGYFGLFKNEDGVIKDASMKELHRVILFDRKLQSLIVEYVGLFELKFRASYSYSMSQHKGAFAHRNRRNFKDAGHFESFLARYQGEFNRQLKNRSSEVFSLYELYGDAPIWAAVEIMSFGTLSMLYRNTKSRAVKNDVAGAFGATIEDFESWTRALSNVRNTCAHFGRLSGTTLVTRPKKIAGLEADNGTPFYMLLILAHLFRKCDIFEDDDTLSYNLAMLRDVVQLFIDFEDVLGRCRIPESWLVLLMTAATENTSFSIADDFINRDRDTGRVWLRVYRSNGGCFDIGKHRNIDGNPFGLKKTDWPPAK